MLKPVKVYINPLTFRLNPDYDPDTGRVREYTEGSASMRFEGKHRKYVPSVISDNHKFQLEGFGFLGDLDNPDGIEFWGELIEPLTDVEYNHINELVSSDPYFQLSIEFDRPFIEVTSMESGPKYLYEYRETVVRCDDCGKEILHTELKLEEDVIESEDNVYTIHSCPRCGSRCCYLEFETVSEFRKRLGL
jgi:DNA-directed RNA polymerase subunit RPC12/RpoP